MTTLSRFAIRSISSLQIAPERPHIHAPSQIEALRRSLREFGFVVPLVIDNSGTVIDGAAVLRAAIAEGFEQAPCVIADHLSESQQRAFHLAVNRLSELASWDRELLSAELCYLRDNGFDIELTGFTADDMLIAPLEAVEDNFDPAFSEVPRCKLGEVWQLGRHRLLVGDCTDGEAVSRLFNGETASLLLTDPPYGVDYKGGTARHLTIANDNLKGNALYKLLSAALNLSLKFLDRGSPFYVWHSDGENGLSFRAACADCRLTVRQTLVWVKPSATLSRQDYHWQHEPALHGDADGECALDVPGNWDDHMTALYGWKPGERHRWCSDRKQTSVVEFPRPMRSEEHPTMKPVKLFAYCIANSTLPNAIVYDPFCGSGTTVIACEQLNRSAYVAELDPVYADVIIRRWEALTGEEAIRS